LPSVKLVRAANGVDYAYREAGGGVPVGDRFW
jgi:hypothetical protein